MGHSIILFDGVCNLCRGSVQFVIKRDTRKRFRFASLQSDVARQLLKEYRLEDSELSAVILIQGGKAYRKSAAALRIAGQLDGLWPLMAGFLIVPRFITDGIYDFIGQRRYRWFGKMEECWLPSDDLKERFLS